jgi:nitroreductase
MEIIEAIHSRRSIRAYTAHTVDRDLIETLIGDAAQAPPPFAGQVPWTFNVIRGAERIAEYGARALQYARDHRPEGATGTWRDRPDFDVFWGAPVVVIISGPVEDCVRAGLLLTLAAHARGLGACWVGSPMQWLQTPDARAEIGIPEGLNPVAVICLGHPASTPAAPDPVRPTIIWQE